LHALPPDGKYCLPHLSMLFYSDEEENRLHTTNRLPTNMGVVNYSEDVELEVDD